MNAPMNEIQYFRPPLSGLLPLGVYQGYPFPQKKPYGSGPEALSVEKEIGDFDYQQSPAFTAVRQTLGIDIRLKEFKAILNVVRYYLKERKHLDLPKPSRNTLRSFPLMIKYVETHYCAIVPFLSQFSLCDEEKNPIPILEADD
jgi:hypothetical protein